MDRNCEEDLLRRVNSESWPFVCNSIAQQ